MSKVLEAEFLQALNVLLFLEKGRKLNTKK
jgi:hypothetical protein